MTDILTAIRNIRENLTAEVEAGEWDNARVTTRQLSDALDELNQHIRAAINAEDVDRHNELVDVYNAAVEHWGAASTAIMNALEQRAERAR
jgi:hypothetical protein